MSAAAGLGIAGGVTMAALGASSVAASMRAKEKPESKTPLVVGTGLVLFGAALSVASARELASPTKKKKKKRNPSDDAADAFEAFHWGEPSTKETEVDLPDFGELFALGKVTKIEYETSKGGERAIWSHDFSRPYPTLTATPEGELGPMVGGKAHVTERGIEG